jgi:hypothetical protein
MPLRRSLSAYIYRFLLRAYPAPFRQAYGDEMLQVFSDLCRTARQETGYPGFFHLWARTLIDLLFTALEQRSHSMKLKESGFLVVAFITLLPTLIFLVIMFSKFSLGIDAIYDAWDSFYRDSDWRTVNMLIELIVILGPAVALLITAARTTRIQIGQENGALISTVTFRASRATIAVILVGLVLFGLVATYGFVEHFRPV